MWIAWLIAMTTDAKVFIGRSLKMRGRVVCIVSVGAGPTAEHAVARRVGAVAAVGGD